MSDLSDPRTKIGRLEIEVGRERIMERGSDWKWPDVANETERAYRRGFQQGVTACERIVGEIPKAQLVVWKMRYSKKHFPEFMHTFLAKMGIVR